MAHFELLFTQDFAKANEEIEQLGGRVIQIFSDSVFEAMMPESTDPAFASKSIDLTSLKFSATTPGFALDETLELFTRAWRHLQTKQLSAAVGAQGLPQNGDEANKSSAPTTAFRSQILPPGTSQAMTGLVALGLVFVSGPTYWLKFGSSEIDEAISNVIKAQRYLASVADPNAQLRFTYYYYTVDIDAVPPASCKDTESCEKVWREPTLKALGRSSCSVFMDVIKDAKKSKWVYLGFLHKYPSYPADAYVATTGNQGLGYICIKYDSWQYGPFAHAFAHETCHVFGAADEYNFSETIKCTCGNSGQYNVPNKNCVNCAPQWSCLMSDSRFAWNICEWSRGQIGWSYWEEIPGVNLIDISVASDGAVWGIDRNNNVVRYVDDKKGWETIPGRSLSSISVASGGQVWGVGPSSDGPVFRYDVKSKDWERIGGINLVQISVADDGTVWGVDPSTYIVRYVGGSWNRIDGYLRRISVGSKDVIWGLTPDGSTCRYTGSGWAFVPGVLSEIGAANDGTVWGNTLGGEIYRYGEKSWETIQGRYNFGAIRKIANGDRYHIWGITLLSGRVLRRKICATW